MQSPRVCVTPAIDLIEAAVQEAGGTISEPSDADAIVWTNPRDPQGLKDMLAASPARWIQLPFAGIETFFEAGVIDPDRTWTCTKGVYGHATAEQALALMLVAARRLHARARNKTWTHPTMERSLAGTTALIIGTGGIGRALASMLEPLKVRIIAANRSGQPMGGAERTVRSTAITDVIGEADWVVVAAAMTPETRHLIGKEAIASMKPDGWIINVARGGLVDTDALVDALRGGSIGGAALDVTDPEPLPDDHPLWTLDDVIITSHTANTVAMALPELRAMVRRNVEHFARGETLEGLVDPALGY